MRLLKKACQVLVMSIFFISQINGQVSKLSNNKSDSLYLNLKEYINETVVQQPTQINASKWSKALWGMNLMLYQPPGFEKKIPSILATLPTQSNSFQYSFLEMLYTNYPLKFATQVQHIWQKLATAKVQAIALEYLALSKNFPLISNRQDTLPPHLQVYLKEQTKAIQQPKQDDFLDANFLPQQVVLCSFQNKNRNLPGYLMIRLGNHQWLSDDNGTLYRFPQLARSITNLPYYLTNGNTPQGLHKLNGWDISDNKFIGTTTNLQMILPFEDWQPAFFNNNEKGIEAEVYSKILSPTLAAYKQLWQSFTAGKLGRSEIIAHGTAINPLLYKNQSYYPNTPSLGCLCSPELRNEDNTINYSSQQLWVQKVQDISNAKGYLIVAEIADFNKKYGKVSPKNLSGNK